MINESLKMKGSYKVWSTNIITGKRSLVAKDNMLCNGLIEGIFHFLNQSTDSPTVSDLNITHISYGDGSNAATYNDTDLGNEIFRKAYSVRSWAARKFTVKLSVAASEGNPSGGIITEIGCVSNGTDTLGTGTLLSHVTGLNITKNSNIKLLIVWSLDA